jgi:serine/threonine protein phosphatase PrpC
VLRTEQRNDENPSILEITTANVGDSRVVLGIGDANQVYTSKRLTHDHRVDDPIEIERIQRAGGFLFRNRVLGILAVTRSIGDHVLKDFVIAHPYVHELRLNVAEIENVDNRSEKKNSTSLNNGEKDKYMNKFLIMACDGLWDVLSDEDAVKIVNSYTGKKEDVAQILIQHALQRGTTDNVTVIVIWLAYRTVPMDQDHDYQL